MRSALIAAALLTGLAAASAAGGAYAAETYDKEATEMVLRRAARQVKENCGHAKDTSGKEAGPWGSSKVSVTLGRNGRAKGATIPPPFEGTPTGRCAVMAFSGLTFPPFSSDDAVVEWDVEIPKP